MSVTEQCEGCGADVTTKRGPVRSMCVSCCRVRKEAAKPQHARAILTPTFDALGFCTGYQEVSE